jgi:hypothetical protein
VRLSLVATLAPLALMLIPAAPASAGRLVATGHDADFHCTGMAQCHFVEVATRYVRGGAPDPNRPVLVLDRDDFDFVVALDNAFGAGAVPRTVLDPRSPEFAAEPLTTDRYSAILIASDMNCGGCDLNEPDSTPDSDAINARANDIAAFFNAGGGIYANSGATHGDGDASNGADNYYSFLPISAGGQPVTGPFCLTDIGAGLGLEDPSGCPDPSRHRGSNDDINCCATHNSFTSPPAGSALRSAETDVGPDGTLGSPDDVVETLVAEGVASGGGIVAPLDPNADNDGDGVINAQDACPTQFARTADGCPLPPLILGSTMNVAVVRGQVSYALPASAASRGQARASARRFLPLTRDTQIPVGSFLNTKRGTVRLTNARNTAGATQSGQFSDGVFQVRQSRRRSARGLTQLRLSGGNFRRRCRTRRTRRSQAQAALTRRQIRRLRSSSSGSYSTYGRYSSATIRGTVWDTIDRCDGTLTRVRRGRVRVRDFRRKRTVTVRAGRSYLARAPG